MSQTISVSMISIAASLLLSSCATSPEVQAKMDEFERTIPTCDSDSSCASKWAVARDWVLRNSEFPIRAEREDRIVASGASSIASQSGLGVTIERRPDDGFERILIDTECFTAFGCPDMLDKMLDFNRTVNSVR